jgi:hypothetical protein
MRRWGQDAIPSHTGRRTEGKGEAVLKIIGKDKAAFFLKGTAKKWFGGDGFGAGVIELLREYQF